jgi:hypothetical protein
MRIPGVALLFLLQLLPATPQPPAAVDGVVIDAVTKQPLAGATLQLQQVSSLGAKIITTTRNDGTFVLRNLPPGGYVIEGSRAGYVPEMVGDASEIPNVLRNPLSPTIGPIIKELKPGQTLSGIRIALTPGSVITGRLTDDHGDVVIGGIVQALKVTYKNGLPERTLVQSVVSNDLGEYRLFMLKPGRYYVSLAPTSGSPGLVSQFSIPLFHPGTVDVSSATVLDLHVGETIEAVNFLSIPTRNRRITGGVQGEGSDGVTLTLSPANSTSKKTTSIRSDSSNKTFEFSDIVPGTYTLVASNVYGRSVLSLDVRNADLIGIRALLGANFTIPARVRIEGHPPGDDPTLEKVYFNVRMDVPVEGLETQVYAPFADGHFTLDVMRRDYWIDIMNRDEFYVKSIMLEGVDVLNQGLHVMGSQEGPMEIVVDTHFGEVQGAVSAVNATVVLVPDAARRNQRPLYKSMRAPSGSFHFEKVPPGDYKVFAWSEDTIENGGPWLNTEYLRQFEDRATPVRIQADRQTIVDRPVAAF